MRRIFVAVLLTATLTFVLAGCISSGDLEIKVPDSAPPAQPAVRLDLPSGLPLALDRPLAITLTAPTYTDVVALAPWVHLGEPEPIFRDVRGEQSGHVPDVRTFQDAISALLSVQEKPIERRPRDPAALTLTIPEPILLNQRLPITATVRTYTDVVGMEILLRAQGPQPVFQGETFWQLGDVAAGQTVQLTSTVIFPFDAQYDLTIAVRGGDGMDYRRSLRITLHPRDT